MGTPLPPCRAPMYVPCNYCGCFSLSKYVHDTQPIF